MKELNDVKSKQEFNVIADLYEDQEGRAESIERHIEYLREKRRKKSMMELYNDLKPDEIENIQKNWPTTMENLKEKAMKFDAKQALKDSDVRPEDSRTKSGNKLLDSLTRDQIMQMYSSDERFKTKEYQTDDPL